MLDDLEDLVKFFYANDPLLCRAAGVAEAGDLYCPPCGDSRRVRLRVLRSPFQGWTNIADIDSLVKTLPGTLFNMTCLQCGTLFTGLFYKAPEGLGLVVLPSKHGGITTPHTPVGVAYYLDQAHKAKTMGAYSAAVAMFRGALEQLLYHQGYKDGMLGKKIEPVVVGPSRERRTVDVVGPICETGDYFALDRKLPEVEQGDLLAIMTAGAYGAVQSGTYNSRPLVPEVLVKGAKFDIVRPRQTYEELIGLDRMPDWLGS